VQQQPLSAGSAERCGCEVCVSGFDLSGSTCWRRGRSHPGPRPGSLLCGASPGCVV
jgi:hypothetical protein